MNPLNARRRWLIVLTYLFVASAIVGLLVFYGKFEQTKDVTTLEQQGAKVLDWQAPKPMEWVCRVLNTSVTQAALRKLPFTYPESVSFPVTPRDGKAAAEALAGFKSVKSVLIFAEEPPVPNDILAALSTLPKLRTLNLAMANISSEGWQHIGHLTELRELYLSANPFTDDDLQAFAALKNLERLSLIETKVTARSLSILATFQRLKNLDLTETAITAENGAQLSAALPNTVILFAEPTATANPPR